ncbi:MAG: DivIVA domain-containing protein [Leptolyngbya sp. SIO4C5]|uniref:ATP synthase F0 subunit B n=1 Tax=Sphaerothrix gracilis TaxID=3151835 RepID=UPI0013C2465B|nr:DivIVA domain-containing protein [Leptolyngbya sp. SIO4C5]
MLRPEPPRIGSQPSNSNSGEPAPPELVVSGTGNIDLQQALNRIEEIVLDSPRIPFSRRTLIDEELLLDQLDMVRLNLPTAFRDAKQVVQRREELLLEAEQIAEEIVVAAEQRAAQIIDEMGIIRQAEQEAQRLRQQVNQECEALQAQTLAEIDQVRQQAKQEWEQMRQQAFSEAQGIQQDADAYADHVLQQMERQFTDMLRVVRNGRQQLHPPAANAANSDRPGNRSGRSREAHGSKRIQP